MKKNLREAAKWFRMAAEQGETDAQVKMAVMCSRGEGVEKDLEASVRWWRMAAEQQNPVAAFKLGLALWEGEGVGKSAIEAHAWIQFAVARGEEEEFLARGADWLKTMDATFTSSEREEAEEKYYEFEEMFAPTHECSQ